MSGEKRFIVTVPITGVAHYEVFATSEEEALCIFYDGEVEHSDVEWDTDYDEDNQPEVYELGEYK